MNVLLALYEVVSYDLGMAAVMETLRTALEGCGRTRYEVSKHTGIPQSVLSRFVHGQPLRGGNLDILADYLDLELRPKRREGKGR